MPRGGVFGDRACDYPEGRAEIFEAAREWAAAVDVGFDQASRRPGNVAAAGHHAPGGLQPEDPVVVRGVADRAANVAAQLQRREPGGDRGSRAARGPARGAGEVPRVAGESVDVVERLEVAGVQRGVGLAEDDCPRRLQPADRQRIGRGHIFPELGSAGGGDQALGLPHVLDRHRQPVQRPGGLAAGCRRVGSVRSGPGPVGIQRHDGVEAGVALLDTG